MRKVPGRNHREGMSVMELERKFPDEKAAREWFENLIWPDGRKCPYCGGDRTREASHKKMPYWCTDCRAYFSAKTGSVMQGSPLPFRTWVYAIYLHITSLKGASSMKLHRDLEVTQKTAWFMLQRIREAFKRDDDDNDPMGGPVEVDETYVGPRRRNMSNAKRKELANTGRGPVGMTAVVGAQCRESKEVRAEVVQCTGAATLVPFVEENAAEGAMV